MNILVTGGAGYIGSHMVRMLAKEGHKAVTLDSLEYGHTEALDGNELIEGKLGDKKILKDVFDKYKIEAVMHFAGYISVAQSVRQPQKYLQNNFISPLTLLEVMAEYGVDKIIFSSTAAVYGNPIEIPLTETHRIMPTNPYGLSKWCFEELLRLEDRNNKIRSISLRYFNASGAALDGRFGEDHNPETHIIPLAIKAALGEIDEFNLFGNNYPTPDGSCVRDYIHVEDLCNAHLSALGALVAGHPTDAYNVGTGRGISNREVVKAVKKISGVDFLVTIKERRPGDVAILVADSAKLMNKLGWKPKYSDLETIVSSAWRWHSKHKDGYNSQGSKI